MTKGQVRTKVSSIVLIELWDSFVKKFEVMLIIEMGIDLFSILLYRVIIFLSLNQDALKLVLRPKWA